MEQTGNRPTATFSSTVSAAGGRELGFGRIDRSTGGAIFSLLVQSDGRWLVGNGPWERLAGRCRGAGFGGCYLYYLSFPSRAADGTCNDASWVRWGADALRTSENGG